MIVNNGIYQQEKCLYSVKGLLNIVILVFALPAWAQQTYRARVVDAKTGEALSYANIYISPNNGTLTNPEGNFTVTAHTDDVLKISYIGYEKMEVRCGDLTPTLRLNPLAMEMREVEIRANSMEHILKKVIHKLNDDYDRAKKADDIYFFRSYMLSPKAYPEMTEGFMVAHSAVNLRRMALLSGMNYTTDPEKKQYVWGSNAFVLYTLGPQAHGETYWKWATMPLKNTLMLNRKFKWTVQSFLDENQNRVYIFRLKYRHKVPRGVGHLPIMEGNAYVDSTTNRLLRYDGDVLYFTQRVGSDRERARVQMHVEYTYEKGFAEITHLSVEGGNQYMVHRSIVFRVADFEGKRPQGLFKDLKGSVQYVGFDPELWTRYDIIQRAKTEEQLIRMSENMER